MKNVLLSTAPRVLLGLIFLAGAIDGFAFILSGSPLIHPPISDRGFAFETALKASGFFWPLLKSIELIGALFLLTNKSPTLGLALLSPIITVVVLFHFFLNPAGIPLALALIAMGIMLAYQCREQLLPFARRPAKGE